MQTHYSVATITEFYVKDMKFGKKVELLNDFFHVSPKLFMLDKNNLIHQKER